LTSTGWRDQKHDEVFEGVLRGLKRRRQIDPGFGLADAEGTLTHLYVQDGNDQDARGELGDVVLGATIAAYEYYIAEWKAERPGPTRDAGQGPPERPAPPSASATSPDEEPLHAHPDQAGP
jgi:hypothetical protein